MDAEPSPDTRRGKRCKRAVARAPPADWLKEVAQFEEKLAQLKASNDRIGELQACASLGKLCEKQGVKSLAQKYYRQSLGIASEINNVKGVMDAHHKLAVLHFTRKKYSLAVPHYTKVIALAREENNHDKLRRCYHELTSIATLQGETATALGWLESYLQILHPDADQDIHCKFTAHRRLGDLYSKAGNTEKAEYHSVQACALHVKMKDIDSRNPPPTPASRQAEEMSDCGDDTEEFDGQMVDDDSV